MFRIFPIYDGICAADGFFCDGVSAGLKKDNAPDIAFIYSDTPLQVEAIFTQNKFRAAPILHYLQYPENFQTNFVLINSKNANALTGNQGIEDVKTTLNALEPSLKTKILNPIMASTGVIGSPLPKEKIIQAFSKFNLNAKNNQNAAQAIMTTDRFEKTIAYEVRFDDKNFKIGAICKGAGMINPSLATMLCFITTDAAIPKSDMKALLLEASKTTFNAISVDGDTSTNDTILLLSNQKSGNYHKEAFLFALKEIMLKLATDIVRDGEGSNKLVAFEVINAKSKDEAQTCAKALSQSLLVKTALFGCDPNWGRIASTIGASNIACDADKLSIFFDDICVYQKGEILFTKEIEENAAKVLQQDSFKITCDIGIGKESFIAYGCDLGYEYVKINADYRT